MAADTLNSGPTAKVTLSTDLSDAQAVPYFLWDEPMTVSELREKLRSASEPERMRLLGKILREARDTEVWLFTTPDDVIRNWQSLSRSLGRRRPFWEFLLEKWSEQGRFSSVWSR